MSRICFCTPEERVSRGCDGSLGGGNSSEGTISKRESELGDHSDAWSSHFMLGEAGVGGRMGMRSERPWGRLGVGAAGDRAMQTRPMPVLPPKRPLHRRGWRSLLPPFEAGPLHYLSPLPALYQVRLQATSSPLHLETAVQTEGRTDHTERRRKGQRGQTLYRGGGRGATSARSLKGEPADR